MRSKWAKRYRSGFGPDEIEFAIVAVEEMGVVYLLQLFVVLIMQDVGWTDDLPQVFAHMLEVIADRNYAAGEEVLLRYGKFPNATLLLDFGFTLPNNIHEQVQISMGVPLDDPLHKTKMELLQRHCMPTVENISTLSSSRGSFTIKEVRSLHRKGKGIPQSLRAFVRVLSATSLEELKELCSEASENDGRLARRPLRSRSREIEAHCILISHINSAIQEYNASIELLDSRDTPSNATQHPFRRQMARDLLTGELRVLKSACSWLTNYCSC